MDNSSLFACLNANKIVELKDKIVVRFILVIIK
jgi:hypothetical protein